MTAIGDQVQRGDGISDLADLMEQAGCLREDAEKASQMIADELEKNS